MKTWCVAYVHFMDNELNITFHKLADNSSWKDAVAQVVGYDVADTLDDFIDTAKETAFDQDWLFDVKEI